MNSSSPFRVPGSRFVFRFGSVFLVLLFVVPGQRASAEVTGVSITSRSVVANGQAFGSTGPYEKLVGRIEFAVDPSHPRNKAIVDLNLAPVGPDKRVHFSADLFVLQPVDRSKGNGTLLFEIANRGRKGLHQRFNRAANSNDPTALPDFGDGFLMQEGYTIVWVGWQFDVAAPFLTLDAPRVDLKGTPGTVAITFILDEPAAEATPADLPGYQPVDPADPSATLTVRNLYWQAGEPIARGRWSFTGAGPRPRLRLEGGFEPGRVYELRYRSLDARVAGAGLAAVRDAASAFLYRDDLPVGGRRALVFGNSQSGRFLRQFLADGFNVDERDRRAFDGIWANIAGAGLGSFNERFAMPGYSSFPATRAPYTGLLARYAPQHQPKVFYTNTSVEYWGQGRAAALTHATLNGSADLTLPENERIYLLASTQHGEAALPPNRGSGQELGNPSPQREVHRALLRAMQRWVTSGATPPESRYPKLGDGTLVKASAVRFPALAVVADPRTIEAPAAPLPFLVPQVDADGNELAGIRVPEVAVPLATTTGWNFRSEKAGNPSTIVALAGSYMPFAKTRAERDARKDPRPSIEERYRNRGEYLQKIRESALALIKGGYLLQEDLDSVVDRAGRHWDWRMQQ